MRGQRHGHCPPPLPALKFNAKASKLRQRTLCSTLRVFFRLQRELSTSLIKWSSRGEIVDHGSMRIAYKDIVKIRQMLSIVNNLLFKEDRARSESSGVEKYPDS